MSAGSRAASTCARTFRSVDAIVFTHGLATRSLFSTSAIVISRAHRLIVFRAEDARRKIDLLFLFDVYRDRNTVRNTQGTERRTDSLAYIPGKKMSRSVIDLSKYFVSDSGSSAPARRLSTAVDDVGDARSDATFSTKADYLQSKLEEIMVLRERARQLLDPDLVSDPAWDILLSLAQAELRHDRLSISQVCDVSNVPGTTGRRWIQYLCDRGYVVRLRDKCDDRRTYLDLSERGSEAMRLYLEALGEP